MNIFILLYIYVMGHHINYYDTELCHIVHFTPTIFQFTFSQDMTFANFHYIQ